MEVIMPKEILASENELPVNLFLHSVMLCVTIIIFGRISAYIYNTVYLCCKFWLKYFPFYHNLSGPEFKKYFTVPFLCTSGIVQSSVFVFLSSISSVATQQQQLKFKNKSV